MAQKKNLVLDVGHLGLSSAQWPFTLAALHLPGHGWLVEQSIASFTPSHIAANQPVALYVLTGMNIFSEASLTPIKSTKMFQ